MTPINTFVQSSRYLLLPAVWFVFYSNDFWLNVLFFRSTNALLTLYIDTVNYRNNLFIWRRISLRETLLYLHG
jgi:hypothetical protein